MSLKKIEHIFKGMNKDTAKNSYSSEFYFDARNIKIIAKDSQSTFAIANEKGTTFNLSIPIINSNRTFDGNTQIGFITTAGITTNSPLIYDGINSEVNSLDISNTSYKIIGYKVVEDFIIFITTNNEGIDCIWKMYEDTTWHIDLVYVNDLSLNDAYPPELEIRFDTETFIKVYFTDTINQLRHILLTDDTIHNQNASFLDIVPKVELSQPIVTNKNWGGLHTAGMIQYAYNLYNISGSQSKLSAVSALTYLASPNKGGLVNEVVGQTNTISIDNIDPNYDSIKLYSVKYNSYGQEPIVSLIVDQSITSTSEVFHDDGRAIQEISLEEFIFLGGDPIYPKTIVTKENRLFLGNYKTGHFDIDFDARAYSYDINGDCTIKNSDGSTLEVTYPDDIPIVFDSINPDFSIYNYRSAGGADNLGGTGKYIDYSLLQVSEEELTDDLDNTRLLKSREIYRIGIEFYNKIGQYSLPKWIGDFKAPNGNLNGLYNILKVDLSSEAMTYLESNNISGWRILRAKRDVTDMTILSQGMINPTMFTVTAKEVFTGYPQNFDGELYEDDYAKIPSIFTRTFQNYYEPLNGHPDLRITGIVNGAGTFDYETSNADAPFTEIFTEQRGRDCCRNHLTYIYSKLFTFNSPEILFRENLNMETSLNMVPLGTYKTGKNQVQGKKVSTLDRQVEDSFTNTDGMSIFNTSGGAMHDYGLIGQSGDEHTTEFYQYYRTFSDFELSYNYEDKLDLIDFPKAVESGQGEFTYTNDSRLRFWNSLSCITTDMRDWLDIPGIDSVNSQGTRSLIFAEKNLQKLEHLFKDGASTNTSTGLPIVELVRTLSNQYGGNSYEARKRTKYLRIGEYHKIEDNTVTIHNAGDIYLQNFTFSRIVPSSRDIYSSIHTQYSEIVEFPVETTIDLKNRKDTSNLSWNTRFQALEAEAHQYNKVYTQESDWNLALDLDYTFLEAKVFGNAVLATKVKLDNEKIDSWTDILYNAELKLNGKYGDITKLITHNDNMIAFQPRGIAALGVSPRVQTIAEDGVSIELGKGDILHDFKYLATGSGSVNRYSILSVQSGLYFYDAYNNTFNVLGPNGPNVLSKLLGVQTFFNNNIDSSVYTDNPFNDLGILVEYDSITKGILVINKGVNPFNLYFNEMSKTFTGFLDYIPPVVINYKNKLLTSNGINMYTHYEGPYNEFYGVSFPSTITLLVNTKENDSIFNTLQYNSEAFIGTVEQSKKTFSKILVYNDYQFSNITPLIINRNIFRKFRNWRIILPRDSVSKLDRIRGSWAYIKLTFEPIDNYEFICHNITTNYEDASIQA